MTTLVYLDSSDFSDLSVPDDQLSAENRETLKQLRYHRTQGSAQFLLSGVHVSEAVHAAEHYKQSAVRRALLMRELCGSNFLRFPIEIFRLELRKAFAGICDARL